MFTQVARGDMFETRVLARQIVAMFRHVAMGEMSVTDVLVR